MTGQTKMTGRRPKRDTENPCAICGWSEHMAIHQPPFGDPEGKPWGHTFEPPAGRAALQGEER